MTAKVSRRTSEPAVQFTCPVCGKGFSRPAWRARQIEAAGAKAHCSYDCTHASRRFRTPEYLEEYHRAYREKNREWINEKQKAARFGPERERMLVESRRRYQQSIDANRQRAREYAANHRAEAKERSKMWSSRNPERALYHQARSNLAASVGLRPSQIPEEVAIAKLEQIKLLRAIKAPHSHGETQ